MTNNVGWIFFSLEVILTSIFQDGRHEVEKLLQKADSWNILRTYVTVESLGWCLIGFVFYEVFIKISAPMPLTKVCRNSVRAADPRWPPCIMGFCLFLTL
jgi:hypothetical protein